MKNTRLIIFILLLSSTLFLFYYFSQEIPSFLLNQREIEIRLNFFHDSDLQHGDYDDDLNGKYDEIPSAHHDDRIPRFSYDLDEICFFFTTNTQRILDTIHEIKFWSNRSSICCLMIFEEKDLKINSNVRSFLKDQHVSCDVGSSNINRYEIRYLHLIDFMLKSKYARIKWFVIGDDDTLWFIENLLEQLRRYNSSDLIYLGNISDRLESVQYHGDKFAYGGGGIILSRPLVSLISPSIKQCGKNYSSIYGGDEMLGRCINEFFHVPLTKNPFFYQIDHEGDLRGYLQSGIDGLVSLHHLFSWWTLFPQQHAAGEQSTMNILTSAYRAFGSNLFKRYAKINRKTNQTYLLTLGYSFSIFNQILTNQDFVQVEKTWCCTGITNRSSRPQQNQSTHWYFLSTNTLKSSILRQTQSIFENPFQKTFPFYRRVEVTFQ